MRFRAETNIYRRDKKETFVVAWLIALIFTSIFREQERIAEYVAKQNYVHMYAEILPTILFLIFIMTTTYLVLTIIETYNFFVFSGGKDTIICEVQGGEIIFNETLILPQKRLLKNLQKVKWREKDDALYVKFYLDNTEKGVPKKEVRSLIFPPTELHKLTNLSVMVQLKNYEAIEENNVGKETLHELNT